MREYKNAEDGRQSLSYVQFSAEDMDSLAARDERLGEFMKLAGPLRRRRVSDPFLGLIRAIMGQQISSAAHRAVWERFVAAFPEAKPETIATAPLESLRAPGLSSRKAEYVRAIAGKFVSGEYDGEKMKRTSDDELRTLLTRAKGIGDWTVDMALIFTFGRPDVLSRADFGIRKGMRMLYGEAETAAETFERRRRLYSPRGSLASFYLWEVASGKYAAYPDPGAKKGK